ncbi:hypothetical protein YPPY64_2391, partial [Yersinia pestis PY-64]|jgi:hypothetical protein
MNK